MWNSDEGWLARLGWSLPYWAFAWPGGQVLGRYLLDHPESVRGKRVLDFGCGGGSEAIAALMCGASTVMANDLDARALVAVQLNAELNGVTLETTADNQLGLLECDHDVILAGDMLYDAAMSLEVQAWLQRCADGGALVLVGDAGRVPLAADFEVLAEYDAPFDGDLRGTTLWRCRVSRLRPG